MKIIIPELGEINEEDDTQLVYIGAREEKEEFPGIPIKLYYMY